MTTILLVLLAFAPPADIIDRIMAVVGSQPLTLSDVTTATEFRLVDVPGGTPDPTGFVLDRLIDRTLMLIDVDRFQPPEPDPSEISVRIDALQARAGSPAAFEAQLAVTGTTRDQLRRYVRDSLRMDTYVNQRFSTLVDPNERAAAIASWISDLRRRAQMTVLYHPRLPPGEPARAR